MSSAEVRVDVEPYAEVSILRGFLGVLREPEKAVYSPGEKTIFYQGQKFACRAEGKIECVLQVAQGEMEIAFFKPSETKLKELELLPWASIPQGEEFKISADTTFALRYREPQAHSRETGATYRRPQITNDELYEIDFFGGDCGGGELLD